MTDDKDWLDDLLLTDRPAPVADEGFVAGVMARLPMRPRARGQWLLPVSLVLGVASAMLVTGAGTDLVTAVQLLITAHQVSVTGLLPAVFVMAGCAWALSEAR
jgi:hypothetical protein